MIVQARWRNEAGYNLILLPVALPVIWPISGPISGPITSSECVRLAKPPELKQHPKPVLAQPLERPLPMELSHLGQLRRQVQEKPRSADLRGQLR